MDNATTIFENFNPFNKKSFNEEKHFNKHRKNPQNITSKKTIGDTQQTSFKSRLLTLIYNPQTRESSHSLQTQSTDSDKCITAKKKEKKINISKVPISIEKMLSWSANELVFFICKPKTSK
jgi:hypothetical protein